MRLAPTEAAIRLLDFLVDERLYEGEFQIYDTCQRLIGQGDFILVNVDEDKKAYVIGMDITTSVAQRIELKVGSTTVFSGNFAANGGATLRWVNRAKGTGVAGEDISITTTSDGEVDVTLTYVLVG